MNWASSQIITEVSKFLMEQGYGCKVEKVPSATTTSIASLAENGEPDIVTELWLNSTGEIYKKLEGEGKLSVSQMFWRQAESKAGGYLNI